MSKDYYDNEKKELFTKKTLEDYYDNAQIEDICNVEKIAETEGSFIQIGIRPLINEDIFLKGANIYPVLPAIGMAVANGERDFLIKNILETPNIERIKIKKENLKEFSQYAFDFNKATILISLDFFVELSQELMHRIEYKNHEEILDSKYKLIFVPEDMMKGKIIIIDNGAIIWEKQKFYNEFTKKEEMIDISIKPSTNFKVDITIRSVNKIKYLETESIKILEIENE